MPIMRQKTMHPAYFGGVFPPYKEKRSARPISKWEDKMKTKLRRILCFAMVLCSLCGLMGTAAFADGEVVGERWNIMLVIDGSASLFSDAYGMGPGRGTDPDGLRFEAINSFIDTLHTRGHNVGAIVYNANQHRWDATEEGMMSAILVNTGINPLNTTNDRTGLKNAIKGAKQIKDNTYQTDTGTALLVAEQELEKVSGNGLRSAIFLFTDGLIRVYPEHEKLSMQNLQEAEDKIRKQGIVLCGVYLNSKGLEPSTEIRDIVCAANDFNPDMNLGNYYLEITDAKSCAESTDLFMKLLGYSIPDVLPIPNDFWSEFRVPGVGVEEANIRLRTNSSDKLPAGIQVTFVLPDGTEAPAASVASYVGRGDTYQVYKVENPATGTWKVHVKVPDDNEVAIYYSPVFSFYVAADMETSVDPANMISGSTFDVKAFLVKQGQALTDPAAYREYTCELTIQNRLTGDVETIEIQPNNKGEYILPYTIGYGEYAANITFSCDELVVSSPEQEWKTQNHDPVVRPASTWITYNFLMGSKKELDLTPNYDDMEDGKNLTLSVTGGTCKMAGVELDGSTLKLNAAKCGDGTVEITVTDSQGASAVLRVDVQTTNTSLPIIIGIVVALLLIVLLILKLIRDKNSHSLIGELTIDLSFPDEEGAEVEMSALPLENPGTNGVKRKTNMDELLRRSLNNVTSRLCNELNRDEEKMRQLRAFAERHSSFLRKINLDVDWNNAKKRAECVVIFNKVKETIYNKSCNALRDGDVSLTVSYFVEDVEPDDPMNPDDDGFTDDPDDEEPLRFSDEDL